LIGDGLIGDLNQASVDREETEEEHRFIVFFLHDDEDQTVHVEEAEEINLSRVFQHLNLGGSIFITHRRNPASNISSRREHSERYKTIQLGLVNAGKSGRWKSYRISKGFRDL